MNQAKNTQKASERKERCAVCHRQKKLHLLVPAEIVRESVTNSIKKSVPEWNGKSYICHMDLDRMKGTYIEDVMEEEIGELSRIEKEVVSSLQEHELLAENIDKEFESELTFGERTSDKVAEFGGSWKFIIFFGVVIVIWVVVNTAVLLSRPFDPYPFILLNLVLSCLAALQAPVIMMSQNRQEAKDRLRSEYDYKINLKSELEVRHINEKMDHLINYQWQRLLEIQKIQLDLIQEMNKKGLQKPRNKS